MDLSFSRLIPAAGLDLEEAPLPAADMALLVAMLSARQGASATAGVQAALDLGTASHPDEPLLAPSTGAFSAAMARRLADWSNP